MVDEPWSRELRRHLRVGIECFGLIQEFFGELLAAVFEHGAHQVIVERMQRRRCLLPGGCGGRTVGGEMALLVFASAAAGAGIVSSNGHESLRHFARVASASRRTAARARSRSAPPPRRWS